MYQDPHIFLLETAALFEQPMTNVVMPPDTRGTNTATTTTTTSYTNANLDHVRLNVLIQTRIDGMPKFELSQDGMTFCPKTGTIVSRASQAYYDKRLNREMKWVPLTVAKLVKLERLEEIKAAFERRVLKKEHSRVMEEAREWLKR
ncbi:hypothetical protein BCR33DRAFT_720352 [Rhizoclosmatium globosum]|uniref:Uncharacterized protein n=1 Tax=Rhizoclosmatium globosum TaxID=329046 RepID=A0A1Y2BWS7_9FUNG|nr:hypothetical protein BCR33DRAFT_720352 [Rhizoclosmatium globosum]|eukprot:ORY39107.1 hypothetical protein BCR33DRAFT_720352 [Rhizoclosmatium globosum]